MMQNNPQHSNNQDPKLSTALKGYIVTGDDTAFTDMKKFASAIDKLIADNNLQAEVKNLRVLENIGVITIECSARVAERIRNLPNVMDVSEEHMTYLNPPDSEIQ